MESRSNPPNGYHVAKRNNGYWHPALKFNGLIRWIIDPQDTREEAVAACCAHRDVVLGLRGEGEAP